MLNFHEYVANFITMVDTLADHDVANQSHSHLKSTDPYNKSKITNHNCKRFHFCVCCSYWEKDGVSDDVVEPLIISIGDEDDDDDDDDDEEEEEEDDDNDVEKDEDEEEEMDEEQKDDYDDIDHDDNDDDDEEEVVEEENHKMNIEYVFRGDSCQVCGKHECDGASVRKWYGCDVPGCGLWYHGDCLEERDRLYADESVKKKKGKRLKWVCIICRITKHQKLV